MFSPEILQKVRKNHNNAMRQMKRFLSSITLEQKKVLLEGLGEIRGMLIAEDIKGADYQLKQMMQSLIPDNEKQP